MIDSAIRGVCDPSLVVRWIWRRLPLGSFTLRCRFDAFGLPTHAYCLWEAVRQATGLGLKTISAIEFGVASGTGLRAIERYAFQLQQEYGVTIEAYGFDRVEGLPKPKDYRDLPFVWKEGEFRLPRDLKTKAALVLGDVKDTVPTFVNTHKPAPLGFVAVDLDFYSSTKDALRILEVGVEFRLPRILCYFDDVVGDAGFFNEYTGELAAIREFNKEHEASKICKINGLAATRYFRSRWPETVYVHHDFNHPRYCDSIAG